MSNSFAMWNLPGSKVLNVFVCDRMESCAFYEKEVSVPGATRVLKDELDIISEFNTAKIENEDFIPYAIVDFCSTYNLTETDWNFLFNELDIYTFQLMWNIGKFDENTVSMFLATVSGLLTEYDAMNDYYFLADATTF